MNYQEELEYLAMDYNDLVDENERLALDAVHYQLKYEETLARLHQCKRDHRRNRDKLRRDANEYETAYYGLITELSAKY